MRGEQEQEQDKEYDDTSISTGSYIATAFRNASLLGAEVARLAPVALIRKGKRFALVPFDATPERRQELLTALEK